MLCAALSNDGQYYRGKVEAIDGDHVLIYYIDYGNDETLALANLKQLEAQHRCQSAFAVKAYLPIQCAPMIDRNSVHVEVKKMTNNYKLSCTIIERYQDSWIVDLCYNAMSLSGQLSQHKYVEKIPLEAVRQLINAELKEKYERPAKLVKPAETAQSQPATVNNEISVPKEAVVTSEKPTVQAPPKSVESNLTSAYISHADQPDRFYLQLESATAELEKFRSNLQIEAEQLAELTDYRTGAMCIAKYSVDDHWYRARIMDTDGEITSIQFIDYGNTDTITDKSLLKAYDEKYDAVAPFAIQCALAIEPRDTAEWADAACDYLHEIEPHALKFEYISEGPVRNYINLFYGECNVAKELIAKRLANAIEIIKSGEKCYTSHINSIDEFYIQMESSQKGLELLERYLGEADRFEPLAEVKAGTMCVAWFDDNLYYRARALSNRSSGTEPIEVLFVDYGNQFVTSDVRSLPQNIAELPHLGKKCALLEPKTIQSWSDDALVKFRALSADGATVFTVRLIETTNRLNIIELWHDGKNISDELATLCSMKPIIDDADVTVVNPNQNEATIVQSQTESIQSLDAYVSHAESPSNFYIQLDSRTAELNEMVQWMLSDFPPLTHSELNTDDIYAAPDQDNACYRCKIIEKHDADCRVRFIDYGNCNDTADFYALPEHLKSIPPLAIHCQLETDAHTWNQDQIQNFLDLVSTDSTFQIEVVDSKTIPQTVRLFHADANVLVTIGHSPNATLTTPAPKIVNQSTPDAPRKNLTFDTTASDIANIEPSNREIATGLVNDMLDEAAQRQEMNYGANQTV